MNCLDHQQKRLPGRKNHWNKNKNYTPLLPGYCILSIYELMFRLKRKLQHSEQN